MPSLTCHYVVRVSSKQFDQSTGLPQFADIVRSLLWLPQGSFHFLSLWPYIGQKYIDLSTSGQMVRMTNGRTSETARMVKYRCLCHWNKWTRQGVLSHSILQSHSSPFYVPETFREKLLMTHRKIPLSLQAQAASAFKWRSDLRRWMYRKLWGWMGNGLSRFCTEIHKDLEL